MLRQEELSRHTDKHAGEGDHDEEPYKGIRKARIDDENLSYINLASDQSKSSSL